MKKSTFLRLAAISIFVKIIATLKGLAGNHIDTWVRMRSIRKANKLGQSRTLELLIHPISCIRYFEFDFVYKYIGRNSNNLILDISSPRIFAFFYSSNNPSTDYKMINPDILDIEETEFQAQALEVKNFSIQKANAISLPYNNGKFDRVISVSVIEHIKGNGDTKAIKEMWRVLKPGGKLILTTHVAKHGRVELRTTDQYNLSKVSRKKYFFQRVYDEKSFRKRILAQIPEQAKVMEIWGEKEKGWFDGYIKRWISRDLEETVYDPWYMITQFDEFKSVTQLPGIGVIGVVFQKPL